MWRVVASATGELIGNHSDTVVDNFDRAGSSCFDRNPDARCPSIDRVFDEFLDDRSWPFDDFAGGDLANGFVVEELNGHGWSFDSCRPAQGDQDGR